MSKSWKPTRQKARKATPEERCVGTASPGGPAPEVPPGSMNRGTCARGRRGTWETSSSPSAELRRYRQAKATKRGGMDGEESERRNRSDDAGEPSRGTPSSKERRRESEPSEGKMEETRAPAVIVSTKLERIEQAAE